MSLCFDDRLAQVESVRGVSRSSTLSKPSIIQCKDVDQHDFHFSLLAFRPTNSAATLEQEQCFVALRRDISLHVSHKFSFGLST